MPLLAMGMVVLVGATGMAIDFGRAQLVQSKLSSSLDAAGLAAGASINSTNLVTEATKYVEANFRNYLGADVNGLAATANADNTLITLTANATVPTPFMRVFGIDSIAVGASSEITRANKGLELAMVLDNTGSMAGTKLSNLKSAAADLVNILYGNNTTVPNLWIGLVPFSQAVNIGPSHASWTSGSFNWGPTSWMGCVDAREPGGRDSTDDPPSIASFPQYYWPDDANNNWINSDGTYRTPLGTYRGPNKSCAQQITPLTASKSTILNGINTMQAVGNTHVNLGAAWGWRLLSPRWRGLWGGEMNTANLPLDYNTPLMNKAAIIMTDGENTMDNYNRTAYWYLSNAKLGTTNQGTAVAQLNSRLSQVCTSMKNNNIVVYTISFGTLNSAATTMLRNCATIPDYYFPSPTNTELQAAFHAIADSLTNLRVSK